MIPAVINTAEASAQTPAAPTPAYRVGNVAGRPVLALGAWLRFKYRLPTRLRSICSKLEHYLYANRGVAVWLDGALVRCVLETAPTPSTHSDQVEEGELMTRVASSLMPGDVFLDVGSHVGLYAIVAARRVGPTGRVIAFEPSPGTVENLARNLTLNGMSDRVEVHELALSNSEGTVEFMTTGTSMMNSIFTGLPAGMPRPAYPERRIRVRTAILDTFFDPTRRTVSKIDTEGHEIPVLRGATTLLNSTARIFIELHPWAWGGDAGDWAELQDLCRRSGREIRLLDGTLLEQPAYRRAELVRLCDPGAGALGVGFAAGEARQRADVP